ncbi:MAG: phage portal protein [Planctomycetota bacterium]|nr:MAG: phage portal protein [Planctomycetota bacterium]
MDKSPLFERAIAAFSPGWAASRARSVAFLQAHQLQQDYLRSYEAASRKKRMDGWHSPSTSANGETEMDLGTIRDRHRELVRNDPNSSRAVGVLEANIGFLTPEFSGTNSELAKTLWKEWAGSTACDADGQHDFDGMQSMAMRATVESGEVLGRRRHRRLDDGLPVPFQVQLVEIDFLDSTAGFSSKDNIIQGVEFDQLGRRRRYHLFKNHPGDPGSNTLRSIPVDASDIAHVYRQDRPGQVRGVPWGAPVMVRLKGFAEYEDAQLMRQKIAACFCVFLTDPTGTPLDARTGVTETISPGLVKRVGPGEGVEFATPPRVDGYSEYAVEQKHAIAAGYGIPYSAMTGDLRRVNFSSGKLGEVNFMRNISIWQRRILQQKFCCRVWDWFQQASKLMGHNLDDVTVTWTPPRRALIDPPREIPAMLKAVAGGLTPLSEFHRGVHGRSSSEVVEEIKNLNVALLEAGLPGLVVGKAAM